MFPIELYGKTTSRCGYCADHSQKRVSFKFNTKALSCEVYESLMERNWRRCGQMFYAPTNEEACCVQNMLRMDVEKFIPSKEQKKLQRKLNHLLANGARKEKEDQQARDDVEEGGEREKAANIDERKNKRRKSESHHHVQAEATASSASSSSSSLLQSLKTVIREVINQNVSNGKLPTEAKSVEIPIGLAKGQSNVFATPIAHRLFSACKGSSSSFSSPSELARLVSEQISSLSLLSDSEWKIEEKNGFLNFLLSAGVSLEKANLRLHSALDSSSSSAAAALIGNNSDAIIPESPSRERTPMQDSDGNGGEDHEDNNNNDNNNNKDDDDNDDDTAHDGPAYTPNWETDRLEVEVVPSVFREEDFQIYQLYQVAIHHDQPGSHVGRSYDRFLCSSPLISPSSSKKKQQEKRILGTVHMRYVLNGKLIAIGVIDVMPNYFSSVYLFYDPFYRKMSIGSLSALYEIEWCRQNSIRYWCPGFYIHSCPKMSYKSKYQPAEVLCSVSFQWIPLADACQRLLNLSSENNSPSSSPSSALARVSLLSSREETEKIIEKQRREADEMFPEMFVQIGPSQFIQCKKILHALSPELVLILKKWIQLGGCSVIEDVLVNLS